jgi:zinc transport system substrate-binding protein
MNKTFLAKTTIIAALTLWGGCSTKSSPTPTPSSKTVLSVAATIPPATFALREIGKEFVSVQNLLPPGQSPHTFEPTPHQIAQLQQAQLLFKIGIEFENAIIPRIQNLPKSPRIVDLREGITLEAIEEDEVEHHGEDEAIGDHDSPEHHHDHQGMDPHIWMSPLNMKQMGQTITRALSALDSAHATIYQQNYTAFAQRMDSLHTLLTTTLAPLRGDTIFVYHPAFGYLTRTYGITQKAIEIGGHEPSARQIGQLVKQARGHHIRVIFVQAQFPVKSAQALAEQIEGSVVTIDPLAEEYDSNLRSIAQTLVHSTGAAQ